MRFNVKNAGLLLLMIIVLAMLTPGAAFAAGAGVTLEVKGYEEVDHNDLSVTNVTKTLDAKTVDETLDAYFVTDAPAVITTLENAAIFSVHKVVKDGNTYTTVGDPLPVTGKVEIWVSSATDPAEQVAKTINASELKNYEVDMPNYLKGCTVTVTEPGYYYIYFCYEAIAGSTAVLIHVEGETAAQTEPPAAAKTTATAKPTASKVLVNGTITSFDAYNIDGSNYFKLRDLAKVVAGTEKQFEVEWNTEMKAINLISNKTYTTVGGEMTKGDGQSKNASLNTSKIYKDGKVVSLTAYNINGNNYFKLRDIASAFNIGITWDSQTNTVGIDTTLPYVAK